MSALCQACLAEHEARTAFEALKREGEVQNVERDAIALVSWGWMLGYAAAIAASQFAEEHGAKRAGLVLCKMCSATFRQIVHRLNIDAEPKALS